MRHVVVIGAGQAGAALVSKLRSLGFEDQITMIGAEPVPPYQRPPLSKSYLLGDLTKERLFIRPENFWADQNVTLHLGQTVTALDTAQKTVSVGDQTIAYDDLVFATGATPRPLPAAIGGDLEGVYTLRSIADIDKMQPEFVAGRRLLVVGGGYIGLEAAAVGRKLGLEVTVIEMAPRILQRVAAEETSDYFRALHLSQGAKILESTALERLTGDTRVTGAQLADGALLPADFVIVGIGVTPDAEIAAQAGLRIDNGIWTDAHGQTSEAHVWAAGDCASLPFEDRQIRLESVGNAIDQAEAVAANILGQETPYVPKPWFWSDQYDCKLQIAGLNTGYDAVVTRPGKDSAVSFWYFRGAQLIAVDAMNDPRAYMVGKRLIEAGKTADKSDVANPEIALKTLLR